MSVRITSIPLDLIPGFATPSRYLYVVAEVGDLGLIKIGRARHPLWRMSSLQAGNSRRLVLLAAWLGDRDYIKALESSLHNHFGTRRVAFEWFRVGLEEVEARIAEMHL